jgi:hypothetical protein
MKFMVLTYEANEDFAAREDDQRRGAYLAAWKAYGDALREAGVYVSGAGLVPAAAATTLRLRDGKRQVQDGPYADTKEQLGGYYVFEVPDLDQALAWAARCPAARNGAVELRPLAVLGVG